MTLALIGKGLLTVQVKSTSQPRRERNGMDHKNGVRLTRSGYIFDGRRNKGGGLHSYRGEVDIFAFVALDIRRVLYAGTTATPNRLVIKPECFSDEACRLSLKMVMKDAPAMQFGLRRALGRALNNEKNR